MIERFYLKNYLSFQEVELNFKSGLVVFTGASGSGKSILINSILATFGLKESLAKVSETILNFNLKLEDFNIEDSEPIIFKSIKRDKVRFFINSQMSSKKRIREISNRFIKHLNLKDLSDFENSNILNLIDSSINSKDFKNLLDRFKLKFEKFQKLKRELSQIERDYKELIQLRDFLEFETSNIESINPQPKEYEELLEHKKNLSKREKIQEALFEAEHIFEFEKVVDEALSLADIEGEFFYEAMNELRNQFELIKDKLSELDNINIEEVLDRLEKLSSLNRKYGSIKEALKYREEKLLELKKYESLEDDRDGLIESIKLLKPELLKIAKDISKYRKEAISKVNQRLNYYLNMLHLNSAKLELESIELNPLGIDEVKVSLNGVSLDNISFGEFNRLRLSLLATKVEFNRGNREILILDEIDANLSGKESQSIGKVLSFLAKSYQIFSISHQPQLTSQANQHFLVEKVDGVSQVREIKKENRIKEIARMISGDEITKEAVEFAYKMVNQNS